MLQEVREIISTRGTGIQGIAIANYIATRIDKKGDSKLEQNILESQKGIADCLDYCSKQAKQFAKNNVAMIADSTVFSWVMDYYNGEWKKDNSVAKNIKKTETSVKATQATVAKPITNVNAATQSKNNMEMALKIKDKIGCNLTLSLKFASFLTAMDANFNECWSDFFNTLILGNKLPMEELDKMQLEDKEKAKVALTKYIGEKALNVDTKTRKVVMEHDQISLF